MKTTFSRNFVTHVVILLAALLLVGLSFQLLVRNYLTDRAIEALKNDSTTISQVAAAYYTEPTMDKREFLTNLSLAAKISQSNAVICDPNGVLLLCSDAPLGCEHQGLTLSDTDNLLQIQSQEHVVSTGIVQGLYPDVRYVVSTPIRDHNSGTCLGVVIVSTPTKDTLSILERMANTYLFVSVLVVLAAIVVMVFYARRTSIPLRSMAKTAIAFGHGDLKARATVPGGSPEEIKNLALAFNNMAQSLEKSEYQRKEFVANVSHELKTPMTTIAGLTDGILDGTIPPEQHRKYLQIVSDETKRLSRLVRSMLDISRMQDSHIPEERKTRFDVEACAGQVLLQFERQITEKALEVQVDFPAYPAYTFADQDAITQVLYNLMDNAVKFCSQGGTLALTLQPDANKIYVRVSNTGATIPPQELPLVFDRFHKLDKSRSQNRDGWGLGLYIVKTIVCSHGEDISVSSENGKTEFTFTLPLVN